jgi:hypothetical protein
MVLVFDSLAVVSQASRYTSSEHCQPRKLSQFVFVFGYLGLLLVDHRQGSRTITRTSTMTMGAWRLFTGTAN